ncbi:DNA-binding MarR family transcriptional regulator [Chitinophaga skermanii]|uniref:DNA-binding MarR family transcriptional regulator n=1 Tax=Chitinophaga skermanii TaxID=331697 RepID=A0A327R4V7_9BACT|nr:MarR family transcriptional regulator [Chitinophaga skermanii]RAJ10982.1 DNA-binding MarR family transcriptional regulator [Chitinophaga skermanii]
MMEKILDEQIRGLLDKRNKLLIKLLALTKKDIDNRLTEGLAELGYPDFKIADMGLLANIKLEGTINNELAKKARITKQAMSKVVKSLEQAGFIYTKKHETDNRATVIFLTVKGKELMLASSATVQKIDEFYSNIIGKEDTEKLREILYKLIDGIYPGCYFDQAQPAK